VFVNRAIRLLLERGWRQRDVALALGLSKSTVSRKAVRMGLRTRSRRSGYDWAAINAYHHAGHTLRDCQREFGLSNGAIDAAIIRGDLHARPQSGRRRGISAEVERLMGKGLSQAEVARCLGKSKSAISYHAKRLGLGSNAAAGRRYDWVQIQAYYDDGHSIRDIQEKFGCARKSVMDAVARGVFVTRPNAMPLEAVFVKGVPRDRGHLKARLHKAGLLPDCCERCGLAQWRGGLIALQLHHKNGDRHDHRRENLELLCPNCHSQTENWGGRNVRRKAA
jgi:transposase